MFLLQHVDLDTKRAPAGITDTGNVVHVLGVDLLVVGPLEESVLANVLKEYDAKIFCKLGF